MHKFLLTLLSIASLFAVGMATRGIASPTSAATNLQLAQRPNCNNPQTQSEMNICASIAYQNADRKLNQVYGFCLADVTEQRTKDLRRYLEVSDR